MQADDFRTDLPVSRGQWRRLAELALDLHDLSAPGTRYDATVLLVRLEQTIADRGPRPADQQAAADRAGDPVLGGT